MKGLQTKFHAQTMTESQVIRSKKSQNLSLAKIYRWVNFSCRTVFFSLSIFYWNYNNRF